MEWGGREAACTPSWQTSRGISAYETPLRTKEGIIDWKAIDWVLHPENKGVAANLPWFLPKMLSEKGLYEHLCVSDGETLVTVKSTPMK
ncbi:MAG: hypothetical protein Q8P50_04760 [Bacillota bacterium]|nr:hypothetical protein [Bacillota bacterium]